MVKPAGNYHPVATKKLERLEGGQSQIADAVADTYSNSQANLQERPQAEDCQEAGDREVDRNVSGRSTLDVFHGCEV
jgi:hypothetical protein